MFVKKDSKGITLIALVITIIVLLILAGITIAFLTGENSIFGKATNAKIENEKAEIREMLSLSVNTIAIEQGQKQDSLSNYYKDKDTFIEKGKLDITNYKINSYEYNEENKIVTITMYKENGTQNQYEYEINIETGSIEFKNKGEIVDPNKANKISYEINGGSFAEGTNAVTEYKKGDIVGFISPIKEGAAFDGWYLNSNFEGESVTKTINDMDGDITLYAKWVDETSLSYFEYDETTIIGFSNTGIEAFKDGKITTLVIPKKHGDTKIEKINANAFKNYSTNNSNNTNKININKLIIQDNITSLEQGAFLGCSNIKELTVPISLNVVVNSNSAAFANCTGITKVSLTKGTGESIDYDTTPSKNYQRTPWYYSKANQMNIIIDREITYIGKNTFNGIKNAKYYYKGSQEEWANVSVDSSNAITIEQYNYQE